MMLVFAALGRAMRHIGRGKVPAPALTRPALVDVQSVLARRQSVYCSFDGESLAGLLKTQYPVHPIAANGVDLDLGMRRGLRILLSQRVCWEQQQARDDAAFCGPFQWCTHTSFLSLAVAK